MPTVAQLSQRHPSCDSAYVADLDALYSGGKKFKSRISRFLAKRPRERPDRYNLRISEAHYRNYLGPVIDYFAAMLFAARPRVVAKDKGGEINPDPGEFYSAFNGDCDKNGGDLEAVFKGRLTRALIDGCSWLRVHQPSDDGVEPATLLEFTDRALGDCWLETLSYDNVLDWETDDAGRLEWAILHKQTAKRGGLTGDRGLITDTWDYLTPTDVSTYAITYEKDKAPTPETDVPLVGSVKHRFGRVPLVVLEPPEGLWVANRLESPQLAHFRSANAQTWSMTTTCYAMAVAKVKDPEAFATMHAAGAGYEIVIGHEEFWEWEAPPSDHFAALDTEIKAHKDEIFRIAHQMALGVENNAAAVGRSADSKKADAEATRVVLLAYSRMVKEAIEYTYDLISAQRGDEFEWSIEGLDDFAAVDVMGLAETLKLVKDIGGIPSKTWNAAASSRLAEAILPDMDQAQKQKVQQEIEKHTPEPGEEFEKQIADLEGQLKMKSMPGMPPNGKQPFGKPRPAGPPLKA